MIMGMCVCAIS